MSLRDALIRLASAKPEFQDELVPVIVSHDAQAKFARGGGRYDAVWIGKNVRVSYHNERILVEEIPGKPLKSKRMGRLDITMWYTVGSLHLNQFLGINLINGAKLSKSMDYDKVVKALRKAIDKAYSDLEKSGKEIGKGDGPILREEQVHYLQVVPLDAKPVDAQGKDFSVYSEWTEFSAYDPGADLQSHDPSYTKIVQKSPGAARKLFKLLKADPNALKSVSWSDFKDWLDKKKIHSEYQFSVWR